MKTKLINFEYKNGFTLIELLIVVLIMSILSVMIIQTYQNAKIKSYISCSIADLKSITTAIESYRLTNVEVPLQYPGVNTTSGKSIELAWNMSPLTFPISYINKIPLDPYVNSYDDTISLNSMARFPISWYNYEGRKENYPDPLSGMWRVWGNGPDRTRQSYSTRPYSVTNGLVSKGDIIFSEKEGFLNKDISFSSAGIENQYIYNNENEYFWAIK